jgi:hypothetical protein
MMSQRFRVPLKGKVIENGPKQSHERQRWEKAIRDVILEQAQQSLDPLHEVKQRDALGEEIARLVNKNPAFSRRQHDEECSVESTFQPLLSSKNIRRILEALKELRNASQAGELWTKFGKENVSWFTRDCQSLHMGLRILGCILLGAALLFAFMLHTSVVWSCQLAFLAAAYLTSVLVDVDDMKNMIPKSVLWLCQETFSWLRWLDATLARGRQTAGREWNRSAYSFSQLSTENQSESLCDCPPPKEGFPSVWSRESMDHITSVNFCYHMLQNDRIRTQAKKKRRALKEAARKTSQHESFFQDKSQHLIDVGEELIANIPEYNSIAHSDMNSVVDLIVDGKIGTRPSGEEISKICGSFSVHEESLTTNDDDSDFDDASSETYKGDDENVGMSFRRIPSKSSLTSHASDTDNDLNWVDVGARIGMRLLHSEHVQRVVASQDTAERIKTITRTVEKKFAKGEAKRSCADSLPAINVDFPDSASGPVLAATETTSERKLPPSKPVHAMWTSASAVAHSPCRSISSMSDNGVGSDLSSTGYNSRHGLKFPHRSPDLVERNLKSSLKRGGTPTVVASESIFKNVSFDEEFRVVSQMKLDPTLDPLCVATGFATPISVKVRKEGSILLEEPPDLSGSVDEPEGFSDLKEDTTIRQLAEGEAHQTRSITSVSTLSTTQSKPANQRPLIQPGVKIVVPIFPIYPGVRMGKVSPSFFQMATVVSCKRVHVQSSCVAERRLSRQHTNCLSVTVILDKCFLRNGKFTQMQFRVMDDWKAQFVPRHSKFPIGACVCTTFGVGILVGWRVEDDCHIVRSLWQRRGAGSAAAYLNRDALHGVVEAAVGFGVQTALGAGDVLGYVKAGRDFKSGRYFVHIKEQGRHNGHVLEFNRCDILSCQGPDFIPVIEIIREASQYQIQVDNYAAAIRHQMHEDPMLDESQWKAFSKGFETVWSSFLLALEEDRDFDEGVNKFFTNVINFLDRLDRPDMEKETNIPIVEEADLLVEPTELDLNTSMDSDKSFLAPQRPGVWLFDSIFIAKKDKQKEEALDGVKSAAEILKADLSEGYKKANSIIRALMKTVSIARASSKDQPNLRLGLSIFYEFLLFLRTIVKVHQKNVSPISLAIWKRAIEEITTTFGPIKERLEKVIKGIAERMERQGNKAKVRILRFVDILLLDEKFLLGLEKGEWDACVQSLEHALIHSKIVDEESRLHYRMTLKYIIRLLSPGSPRDESAAARNNAKMAQFAKALKWIASPRRSLLKLLCSDYIMELLERVFIRVFRNEPVASRMITIHASNIHTLRQLRMLKDFTIAGKLWIPMLDAADEEFSWAVTKMPDNFKDVLLPLSKLFSLCVAQFHRIGSGDLTADWLNFLMQDDAVSLIHQLDERLILDLESFCKDIKEVMVVLPYYPSIDEDILNLMDEVDIDELLREASEAFVDADKLTLFLREKSTLAIERFLDYLPKMSIPVERRDLRDGWVLTCRGEDGGDLTLSDVSIKRENLTCKVLGGDSIFFPMFGDIEEEHSAIDSSSEPSSPNTPRQVLSGAETSILDQVRELLLTAQFHGCWQSGIGGVGQQPTDRYVATVLRGLPISSVLNCGIELWRNLEIDDDELLEIAIRDVSFQIKLQKEREEGLIVDPVAHTSLTPRVDSPPALVKASDSSRRRFNPRVDPTVLFLEMRKLTLNLEKFHFRIEKEERRTIFDPVFEGHGNICVHHVSILLRVECKKGRVLKLGTYVTVPVLQLQDLDIKLEKVRFTVKDTGADWLLNGVVKQFQERLTEIVEANLKEQVHLHIQAALENLNSHFSVNPKLLLGLFGISIDDLEEGEVVWV